MCHYRNTTFTCGCQTEENTLVCGYVHDDLAQCMADTQSDDVSVPRVCGRKNCKNVTSAKPRTRPHENHEAGHTRCDDEEWSEGSVDSSEL